MQSSTTNRRTFIVVAMILVGVIAAHYLGLLSPVERLALRGLTATGKTSLSLVDFTLSGTSMTTPSDSAKKIADLEQRVSDLMTQNVELRNELTALKESSEQQQFLESRKLIGVQARIFARSSDPTSSYIVIDRGSNAGIRTGSPVVVRNGIFIGKVISITDETARVLLSTDNRSSVAGVSATNAVAQGVVSGTQGLSLHMELIPQSETLALHEIIITSGINAQVPRGLILGEIERISKQQGALFQSAVLHTPYLATTLDLITVLSTATQ